VVEVDGVSSLCFTQSVAGDYYVAVRHRNHIGTMTANAITMTATGTLVDFPDPNLDLWSNSPFFDTFEQKVIDGKRALWAGNTLTDDRIVFAGQNNDLSAIFAGVDGAMGNFFRSQAFVVRGYSLIDVNLDGRGIFAGQNNDVNPIFDNVDGHPRNIFRSQAFIILEQLAE
jgi:hypothetical protein